MWADFAEALLPTDPGRTCTFRLASEYGRPGGVWCAEALAGLSGAVVRAAVTGGLTCLQGLTLLATCAYVAVAVLAYFLSATANDPEDLDEADAVRRFLIDNHDTRPSPELPSPPRRIELCKPKRVTSDTCKDI